MGRNHGWSIRRFVRGAAAGAALVACSSAPLTSHAYPAQAVLVQFTPAAGGLAGGTTVSTDFGRLLQGAARLEGTVATAARVSAVAASVSPAANASRVIAAACFANPVLCTVGVGAAALTSWLLLSKITLDNDGVWQKETVTSVNGTCYKASDNIGSCYESGADAALAYGNRTASPGVTFDTATPNGSSGSFFTYRLTGQRCTSTGCTTETRTVNVVRQTGTYDSTEKRPAVGGDFDEHATAHPAPDDVLNVSPVPVPVGSPTFEKTRDPLGNPYKAPGDLSGFRRDVLTIEGKPDTADPLDVEVTPETIVADDPSTPENEEEEADPEAPGEKPEDLCLLHPNSVGCTDLGNAPDDQVPTRDVTVDYTAETVGLPVGCPAPVSMGSLGVLTFDGACEAATTSRPFVISFAALAAAMLMLAAIRRQ